MSTSTTSLPSDRRNAEVVAATTATLSCPGTLPGEDAETSLFAVGPAMPDGPARSMRPARATRHVRSDLRAVPLGSASTPALATTNTIGRVLDVNLDSANLDSANRASANRDSAGPMGVTVAAEGQLAPGATAVQQSAAHSRRLAGLAVTWCQASAGDWWFHGVSVDADSTARLVISNPSAAIAAVDLSFDGPTGVVEALGARGIAVAPQSREVIDLSRFALGLVDGSVGVAVERGRVGAALQISQERARRPVGTEWVSPAARPSRDVLVNPGLAGSGAQRLLISNPGDREALAQVRVLEASGRFTPRDLTEIRVPPGSTTTRDITDVTGGSAAALQVRASVRVGAALISDATDASDFTVTSSSVPLSQPAVVPVLADTRLTVQFATESPLGGRVTIESRDARGKRLGTVGLAVRGAATSTWRPRPALEAKTAYLVVTAPRDAGIQGSTLYEGRAGVAAVPLLSARWTVVRPAVRPAP